MSSHPGDRYSFAFRAFFFFSFRPGRYTFRFVAAVGACVHEPPRVGREILRGEAEGSEVVLVGSYPFPRRFYALRMPNFFLTPPRNDFLRLGLVFCVLRVRNPLNCEGGRVCAHTRCL